MRKRNKYSLKKKRWHQRRYRDRFEKGLCPACGGKRTGEWIICETCRAKSRAYSQSISKEARQRAINKYRDRCRKQGICYGCGSYVGLGNYKRCGTCREKDRLAHAIRYAQGR